MSIFLTGNNIRNFVGRQVFDPTVQNDVGVGTIVSTFEVSGELGVEVQYVLDRLRLYDGDQMSGVIQHHVSGNLNNGGSYIDWAAMSDAYVAANPSERGASFRGMFYSTLLDIVGPAGGYQDVGVFGTRNFRLFREVYFNGSVLYYPDEAATVSGLPAVSSLRVV